MDTFIGELRILSGLPQYRPRGFLACDGKSIAGNWNGLANVYRENPQASLNLPDFRYRQPLPLPADAFCVVAQGVYPG